MRSIAVGLTTLALALVSVTRQAGDEAPGAGLVTLYAQDDLQSSFDFRAGRAGGHVEQGEIRLEDAQIAFDVFMPDRVSFGFVHDERVEVLDLGAFHVPPQARSRDLAVEFPIALFHTLFFDGVRFGYLGADGDRHPLDAADRILGTLPPERLRHVDPIVGHTYLVRVRRDRPHSADEFFKFQVVDLVPEQSLTLRWAALGRN